MHKAMADFARRCGGPSLTAPRDSDFVDWTRMDTQQAVGQLRMNSEKRSLEQNGLLHPWCREISEHINERAGRQVTSMDAIKELVKMGLGNVLEVSAGGMTERVAMPTNKYKRTEADLTDAEKRRGIISMDQLLSKIQAWAATDLGLELESREAA